jgi:hydrogenase expression/formation protein HypE
LSGSPSKNSSRGVVEKGAVDGIFINTSGIGLIPKDIDISIKNARPGDLVIISGTIGDHGMAVMMKREGIEIETTIESDVAPLVDMVSNLMKLKDAVKVLRDPTRGGVAEVLYDISVQSGVGIELNQKKLPIHPEVDAVCKLLGLEPLELANEGKIIAVVAADKAKEVLDIIKKCRYGENAQIIGLVNDSGIVTIKTPLKASRIVPRPMGDMLPRIC